MPSRFPLSRWLIASLCGAPLFAGCSTPGSLPPVPSRHLPYTECWDRDHPLARVGLAACPSLDPAAFDWGVLRWVTKPAALAAFRAAVDEGAVAPLEGVGTTDFCQIAIQFSDGSGGWAEFVLVNRHSPGLLAFSGEGGRRIVRLTPAMQDFLDAEYGWAFLERVLEDNLETLRSGAE